MIQYADLKLAQEICLNFSCIVLLNITVETMLLFLGIFMNKVENNSISI